ncbi:MAG: peptidase [Phycisphaerales bacterium]|nr:peptidase [Phycisphaerales bacterium]
MSIGMLRPRGSNALILGIAGALLWPAVTQADDLPLHLNFTRPSVQVDPKPSLGTEGAGLDIVLTLTGFTPSQEAAFTAAEAAWEARLTGYRSTSITSVAISGDATPIDGVGGILGSAGPTFVAFPAGYTMTTVGEMEFDSADIGALEAAGTLGAVIEHEMAHVLGFGTLWECNPCPNNSSSCFGTTCDGVATDPDPNYTDFTGEFLGPAATSFWVSEFGQTGTPDVELGGGPGTANGHWNEVDGGAGLTGITSSDGDMRDELMTGWLNPGSFVSDMTLAAFFDNGYTTTPVTPVELQSFSIE